MLKNVRYANGTPLEQDARQEGHRSRPRRGWTAAAASSSARRAPSRVIRVMAEGDDERLVQQVVGDIADAVRKAAQAGCSWEKKCAAGLSSLALPQLLR